MSSSSFGDGVGICPSSNSNRHSSRGSMVTENKHAPGFDVEYYGSLSFVVGDGVGIRNYSLLPQRSRVFLEKDPRWTLGKDWSDLFFFCFGVEGSSSSTRHYFDSGVSSGNGSCSGDGIGIGFGPPQPQQFGSVLAFFFSGGRLGIRTHIFVVALFDA